MKDPDSENLDAGWDDLDPVAPPVPSIASGQPEGLDELDDGWDESSPAEPSAEAPAGRSKRLGKRERRELERKKRALAEQRKAERKAAGKRERQEAARRAAAEHEEERRRALERRELERRELERREERPKRRRDESPERALRKSRSEAAVSRASDSKAQPRRRFEMPSGGWIIVVISLITLATAWYAFWR